MSDRKGRQHARREEGKSQELQKAEAGAAITHELTRRATMIEYLENEVIRKEYASHALAEMYGAFFGGIAALESRLEEIEKSGDEILDFLMVQLFRTVQKYSAERTVKAPRPGQPIADPPVAAAAAGGTTDGALAGAGLETVIDTGDEAEIPPLGMRVEDTGAEELGDVDADSPPVGEVAPE